MFKKAIAGFSLATLGTSVLAAVPESVNTELATAKTDALTVAGAVLAVIIAIYAFKLVRRAL